MCLTLHAITFDFRGHGKTVAFGHTDEFSFKQFAEDVLIREAYTKVHDVLQDTDTLTAQNRYGNSEIYKN